MSKLHQVQLDTDGVTKVINQISLPESPYVVPSDATPLAPGTADPGLSDDYSRGDHRHPMQVVSKGNITKGEEGDLSISTIGLESKINVQFPEYVASDNTPLTVADAANAGSSKEYARADHQHPVSFEKGTVSNGTVADVSFTRDGNSVKLNMVDPAYAGHTDSAAASNTMAATMPDGGIIIERAPGEKPVLKQKIGSTLEATKLGGTQATYTDDADGTDAILPDVEDGALIVEGPGQIVIDADVAVSAEAGNTLERKSDGLFTPKSAVVTANAAETESILPSLAEGSIIIEGPGDVVVETNARVSEDENNIITKEEDGIAVSIKAILDVIYPVGSYAFGAKPTVGTWEEVEGDRALWLKNTVDDGTEIEQALPNISGSIAAYTFNTGSPTGAFTVQSSNPKQSPAGGDTDRNFIRWDFRASSSNSIYKNGANVQPNAYVMKVYKRVA